MKNRRVVRGTLAAQKVWSDVTSDFSKRRGEGTSVASCQLDLPWLDGGLGSKALRFVLLGTQCLKLRTDVSLFFGGHPARGAQDTR